MENKDELAERERLKQYRDYRNVINTAYEDGFKEGFKNSFKKSFREKIILKGHELGLSVEILVALTELPNKDVLEIIQNGRNTPKN